MRRIFYILACLISAVTLHAQYTPPSIAGYFLNGSIWAPMTTTASGGAVGYVPPSYALYCYNTSLNQWVPAPLSSGCGGTPASSNTVASAEVVTYSATPTFSTSTNVSRIVLAGNITSFTLGAGADGQSKTLCFKQGSGSYTVSGPANVRGFFTVGTNNGGWNCQSYVYDLTDSIWLSTATGIINM